MANYSNNWREKIGRDHLPEFPDFFHPQPFQAFNTFQVTSFSSLDGGHFIQEDFPLPPNRSKDSGNIKKKKKGVSPSVTVTQLISA